MGCILTPNMFLRSGSLNLNGILDTWSRLGVVWGFGAGSKAPLLLLRRPPLTEEFDSPLEVVEAAIEAAIVVISPLESLSIDSVLPCNRKFSSFNLISVTWVSKSKVGGDPRVNAFRKNASDLKIALLSKKKKSLFPIVVNYTALCIV